MLASENDITFLGGSLFPDFLKRNETRELVYLASQGNLKLELVWGEGVQCAWRFLQKLP